METDTPRHGKPLLSIQGLRTHFQTMDGVVRAVDGVDLTIYPGQTFGLVGESGCGKSITALSVLRLIPTPSGRIAAGRVIFDGRDLLKLDPVEMRQVRGNRIAMIFQEPMTSLNPVFTVGRQIAEALVAHREMGKREAWSEAVGLLTRVGIPSPSSRARDYPHQLSGGMRQRAMIAMAMACRPELLIADEPTTALDVTIQAQILDLIQELKDELGMAVLLITPQLRDHRRDRGPDRGHVRRPGGGGGRYGRHLPVALPPLHPGSPPQPAPDRREDPPGPGQAP